MAKESSRKKLWSEAVTKVTRRGAWGWIESCTLEVHGTVTTRTSGKEATVRPPTYYDRVIFTVLPGFAIRKLSRSCSSRNDSGFACVVVLPWLMNAGATPALQRLPRLFQMADHPADCVALPLAAGSRRDLSIRSISSFLYQITTSYLQHGRDVKYVIQRFRGRASQCQSKDHGILILGARCHLAGRLRRYSSHSQYSMRLQEVP